MPPPLARRVFDTRPPYGGARHQPRRHGGDVFVRSAHRGGGGRAGDRSPLPAMDVAPAYISCRFPRVRWASNVHAVSGPHRDAAAHLLCHLLRAWPLFLRAFSCPRRAQRWAVGLRDAGDALDLPPLLDPDRGRVVRVGTDPNYGLFDLAKGDDCARFLRVLAADKSLNGVRVVPVCVADGPSPSRLSVGSATEQEEGPAQAVDRRSPDSKAAVHHLRKRSSPNAAPTGTVELPSARPTQRRRVAWNYSLPLQSAALGGARALPCGPAPDSMSATARHLLSLLSAGRSVFLTGPPGCGKTHVIMEVKAAMMNVGIAVCGSSGVAAALVDGVTLHSWAGFRNGENDVYAPLGHVVENVIPRAAKARMAAARLLVVDEATTLSAEFFSRLDEVLQSVRGDGTPFGGLVVLMAGDFLQVCPPRGRYAFTSSVWMRVFGKSAMVMATNFRHAGDPTYLALLLRLRLGLHTQADLDLIATRQTDSPPPDCTWLFCADKDVRTKNSAMLAALPGPEETFQAVDTTRAAYLNDVQAGHLLNNGTKYVATLTLRVGAKVRVPTNVLAGAGVVSGSHGTVLGFGGPTLRRAPLVRFQLMSGGTRDVVVVPAEARVMAFDGVTRAATRMQIPLVLSWASTVHSAQGWTLARMAADLGEAFAPGQVLSALSRTRRLCDNFLLGFDEHKVIVSPEALAYHSSIVSL